MVKRYIFLDSFKTAKKCSFQNENELSKMTCCVIFCLRKKTAFLKTPTYGLKWTKRLMTKVVLDLAGRGTFHVPL